MVPDIKERELYRFPFTVTPPRLCGAAQRQAARQFSRDIFTSATGLDRDGQGWTEAVGSPPCAEGRLPSSSPVTDAEELLCSPLLLFSRIAGMRVESRIPKNKLHRRSSCEAPLKAQARRFATVMLACDMFSPADHGNVLGHATSRGPTNMQSAVLATSEVR